MSRELRNGLFCMGVGALGALGLWTLPNWELFAQSITHFSVLWQIATNRHAMMILVVKVFSPLLVGSLLAACSWLWYLIKPFLQEDVTQPQAIVNQNNWSSYVPQFVPHSLENERRSGSLQYINPETPIRQELWDNQARKEDTPVDQQTNAENQATPTARGEQPRPYEVSITLLKKVGMTLMTANGISREIPLTLNAKRVQLLAYLACLRGQPVNRDRMLEQVFGHGRDDKEATREKLGEAFDSHKKLLRFDLRQAATQLNAEAGAELFPPDLDIFSHKQRVYWLSEVCHVVDLEELEQQHQIIDQARKDGLLVNDIPVFVKDACDRLIAAYSGDFLEQLVNDYLDDFEPWTSSWARKPYTLYRDYYLQALWYAAEYEERLGNSSEHEESRQHWELAAHYYRTYAMTACNSRFDTKVSFAREQGERVVMSERALRRCLVLYGSIGQTHLVDQVYAAYYKQMRHVSAKAWEPSTTTLADLQSAKAQTNAYRFPTQIGLSGRSRGMARREAASEPKTTLFAG